MPGSTAMQITSVEELRRRLRLAWRAETSLLPADWSTDNPAVGQCAVTALVVQDLFGGQLLRGRMHNGTHYWNVLPDGRTLDLTASQFDTPPVIVEAAPRAREYILSFAATGDRYLRLRANLGL